MRPKIGFALCAAFDAAPSWRSACCCAAAPPGGSGASLTDADGREAATRPARAPRSRARASSRPRLVFALYSSASRRAIGDVRRRGRHLPRIAIVVVGALAGVAARRRLERALGSSRRRIGVGAALLVAPLSAEHLRQRVDLQRHPARRRHLRRRGRLAPRAVPAHLNHCGSRRIGSPGQTRARARTIAIERAEAQRRASRDAIMRRVATQRGAAPRPERSDACERRHRTPVHGRQDSFTIFNQIAIWASPPAGSMELPRVERSSSVNAHPPPPLLGAATTPRRRRSIATAAATRRARSAEREELRRRARRAPARRTTTRTRHSRPRARRSTGP